MAGIFASLAGPSKQRIAALPGPKAIIRQMEASAGVVTPRQLPILLPLGFVFFHAAKQIPLSGSRRVEV
jgi:hypothetical protein